MRKFLNAGLESYGGRGQYSISCEEADVMADEAQADLAEASGDLETAERLADVSDAMEDMAAIVDGVEEPSDAERSLVEVAGDMAVAGTDAEAEDVMVPATESFGRIGMESIGEKAKQIWDKVLAMLKKVWEKIESFFYKIFGSVPSKRRTLKSLREAVEKASNGTVEKENKKFKVSSTKGLTVNNQAVKTAAGFQTSVGHSVETVKWVLGAYATQIKTTGEALADAMDDFDVDQPAKFAESVASKATRDMSFPGKGSEEAAGRFSGLKAKLGYALLGNTSLVQRWSESDKQKGPLAILDNAKRAGLAFGPTNYKKNEAAADFEMETLSVGQMEKLLDGVEEILDSIEDFSRGSRSKDISTARKKIETASAKASTAWDKRMNDKDAKPTEADRALFKSALGINLAYAGWAKEPISTAIQHGLHVTSTVFALVAKSASLHK